MAATLQELAVEIIDVIRHHERNCRRSSGQGAACVELQECREEMADMITEQLRKANRK